MIKNIENFDRVKGADWFPFAGQSVLLIGAGGIGSWTGLLLSRIGANLYIMDGDLYEKHNMSGQFVDIGSINKNKAQSLADNIEKFTENTCIANSNFYTESSPTNKIVICGLDNMEARKLTFRNWKKYINNLPEEERKKCIFIDGRLTAELFQIYSIKGNSPVDIENYEKDALFNDSEVEELPCTFKQTSHLAAMIAGHITNFYVNWINSVFVDNMGAVPYFYQYFAPLNLGTYE